VTTLPQTVLLLDELAATYRVELAEGDAERWHRQLGRFHIDDVTAALDALQASPAQFMPTVGAFTDEVRQHVRRNGPTEPEPCAICDGTRWREGQSVTDGSIVYETVRPCEFCSPELLEAARAKVAETRKRSRGVNRDTLLPYRLGEKLAEAREGLRDITEPKSAAGGGA